MSQWSSNEELIITQTRLGILSVVSRLLICRRFLDGTLLSRSSVLIMMTLVLLRSMTMALECQFFTALLFLVKNLIDSHIIVRNHIFALKKRCSGKTICLYR